MHDPRLAGASRRLTVIAWLSTLAALLVVGVGSEWLFVHRFSFLAEILWNPPGQSLVALVAIAGLAPSLAAALTRLRSGGRGASELGPRRLMLGLVGLAGAAMMFTLTQFDMAMARRTVHLVIRNYDWCMACAPHGSGQHQAAFVGLGGLALVLRLEALVLKLLASRGRVGVTLFRRSLRRLALVVLLAAGVAAPFMWLGIEVGVDSRLYDWQLPAIAYLAALAVLEIGMLLSSSRRVAAPASCVFDTEPSVPARPREASRGARERHAPDPAALALAHQARSKGQRWIRAAKLIGSLALVVAVFVSGAELFVVFEAGQDVPAWPIVLLVSLALVSCLSLVPSPEVEAAERWRPTLPSPVLQRWLGQIERVIELLERGLRLAHALPAAGQGLGFAHG